MHDVAGNTTTMPQPRDKRLESVNGHFKATMVRSHATPSEEKIERCLEMVRFSLEKGHRDAAVAAIDHAFETEPPLTIDSHVEAIGLRPEVVGHLSKINVITVRDLQRVTEKQLRGLSGVGDAIIREIRDALRKAIEGGLRE